MTGNMYEALGLINIDEMNVLIDEVVQDTPFCFSIMKLFKHGEYFPNFLKQIAIHGDVRFTNGYAAMYYVSEIVTNPTWLTVCEYCARMIELTDDRHHVFLEGIDRLSTSEVDTLRGAIRLGLGIGREGELPIEDNVSIYRFSMGS